ncbi:hypothetical protein CSKR_113845 [Clonorchis sinensis]|uniref:Uncharacterized protein n=1 Tax=Clonorchis sinensis TaxID=79923 RepID=A0A8T1M2N3_CLOSI|nr:hypothetical protein CSKR_113845 [Clonorchis sinensis]
MSEATEQEQVVPRPRPDAVPFDVPQAKLPALWQSRPRMNSHLIVEHLEEILENDSALRVTCFTCENQTVHYSSSLRRTMSEATEQEQVVPRPRPDAVPLSVLIEFICQKIYTDLMRLVDL